MKKTFALAFSLFISLIGNAQNTSSAGEYMDYFSVEYVQIQQDMWDYARSVSHGRSARKVEKRRAELIQTVENAYRKAKSAKPFNNDSRYKDSVTHYFELTGIVLREDYGKIVDLEEVAEQSYDLMEAYMLARELASDKLNEAGKMVNREHRSFAEANNITIIEGEDTELDKKMEITNKVYDHYNAVYLVFFKSFKQELYLLDAIQKNDVSAIEQNRNALLETLKEGEKKLATIEKYANDPAMVNATNELFAFYKDEANEGVKYSLNYLEKTENFNKIKTVFDAKKQKDRTQADVDEYNGAVNEMNLAVNEVNAASEANNKRRSSLIDNWNREAEKFTSRHVPKGK